MPSGPDQGFAWMIALACFFINFIMAGLARTAGVLFVAIIDLYGVSREAATTPFSLRVCVRNMTGPIIGLLGQKYGIRIVSAVGGLIAALGSIFCYFAPNVFWITIFWGIIHGLGFGLSTVLHMMAVNQYFDKYKASALGLGYSGDCFGTFAFPIMIEYFFTTYGVRGSFLIIGGIVLNTIPMALLLRKPPWLKDSAKRKKSKNSLRKKISELKTENVFNCERCERNKKIFKPISQVGMLSTVNENDNLEKANKSGLNENIANRLQFSTFGYDLKGHCNKAFESSENDVSSLQNGNSETVIGNSLNNANSERKNLSTSSFRHSSFTGSTSSCKHGSFTGSSNQAYLSCEMNSSLSNLNDSKNFKKTDDLRVYPEIKMSRSASDLNQKNQFPSRANRSLRLNAARCLNSIDRTESLPPVKDKGAAFNERKETLTEKDDMKNELSNEIESPPADEIGNLRKRRTSSFVGQVAQEIVNRMRTASFASSIAQDAFISPIPQEEEESDIEQELECELKSIVEHKNHDVDDCAQQDLILAIDKSMTEDYFKEVPPEKPHDIVEQTAKPPSLLKVMLRTNLKPMFILISVSMAVYAFLFVSILTIIIDYAADNGVPNDKGKYLVIGFSVADLFGRLSFGQIIDRKLMKMKNYSGCTMLLMGLLAAVIPLNISFNYMMVCMCMYGLVQGGTAIMFPILINTYMDKNSESVAMGCVNFYGGLLMLLMAPMIGYFRDSTGSYNYVFYIIGGSVAVVGIVWQFEPMIIKYQKRKLREKYIMESRAQGIMQ